MRLLNSLLKVTCEQKKKKKTPGIWGVTEIMEEYARGEEEATLELQTIATQEESPEEIIEAEQALEERRNRKRNTKRKKQSKLKKTKLMSFCQTASSPLWNKQCCRKIS